MFFKKMRTALYVYKIVDSNVNSRYKIKIRSGLGSGMPHDNNSDARAKNEVVRMILSGEVDRGDVERICNTYMAARESILAADGFSSRWE